MTKLIVDGVEVEVDPSLSLLEAVEMTGQEVPRFCYHSRLSVAGNCRMCLVDVVGEPKLVASCSRAVRDIRPGPDGAPAVVETQSEKVRTARASVMEFLLINHPLDCPICDQGGECDLQDQAMAYGLGGSRYEENKRAVEDKELGPLVKTTMTRCIHCTRCVRFMTEVAGVEELGATGRGESMEIMSYLERGLSSEMQGNIADLCPVGALTHKPTALSARAWEYNKTESIDVMDGLGSHIRLDSRGEKVLRILPRTCEAINAEWLSDKSRYCVDGLSTQRLDQPYIRRKGRLEPATWQEALACVAERMKAADARQIAALVGDLAGVEEGYALKSMLSHLNVVDLDGRVAGADLLSRAKGRSTYLFNQGLAAIDEADALLLIGCNPRKEASVFNARIRQRWLRSDINIGLIGSLPEQGLNYDYTWLGSGLATLHELVQGKHSFLKTLKGAKKPLIVLGEGALSSAPLVTKLASMVGALSPEWIGYSVLHSAASRVGNLEIDLIPGEGGRDRVAILDAAKQGEIDVLYLMGFDDITAEQAEKPFVVYQGSHGDQGAHVADVIFPGAAYSEKSVTYVNTEGRVQLSERAVFPPGEARDDWSIIRALSGVLGVPFAVNTIHQLRQALYADYPDLAVIDQCLEGDIASLETLAEMPISSLETMAFGESVANLYQSNVIARASRALAEADRFRSTLMAQEDVSHG